MREIKLNAIYSTEELKEVLGGSVSIETLRAHHLIGSRNGYYGRNIIEALDEYWKHLVEKRKYREKGDDLSVLEQIRHGEIRSIPGKGEPVESQRERCKRLMEEDKIQRAQLNGCHKKGK